MHNPVWEKGVSTNRISLRKGGKIMPTGGFETRCKIDMRLVIAVKPT